MKLTAEQVRHVAKLARLALSPEEAARAQQQLSAILDAVDEMAHVSSRVESREGLRQAQPERETTHLRGDEVHSHLGEQALDNAPQKHDSSFSVPRVIE